MSPQSPQSALDAACEGLRHLTERYGPLIRGKGVNMFKGVDMIDHRLSGLPLNKLGIIVVAMAKMKQWEAVTGQAYLDRIDEQRTTERGDEDPIRFLETSLRQAKTQQHTAVDTSAGEANTAERHSSTGYSKGGTITVDRRYFYRLELENDLYRRHLSRFEAGVAHKLATSVQTVLSESQESAQKKNEELALTEHCRKPIESDDSVVEGAERGKKRARESGQEEDEALAILQERFDVKRRKV